MLGRGQIKPVFADPDFVHTDRRDTEIGRGLASQVLGTRSLGAQSLSHVQLFATPRTVAWQAPLSMGFPRQEYWGGLPFSSPGDLPDPGVEPAYLASLALAGGLFTTEAPGRPSGHLRAPLALGERHGFSESQSPLL